MKILQIEYKRVFGGGAGSHIEQYGSESIVLTAGADEDESITIDDVERIQADLTSLKRMAYKIHALDKKKGGE